MTMKIPKGALVVVANGGNARVFVNRGEANALSLSQEALLDGMDPTDDGPSGAMPPDSSGPQLNEAAFAKQLANRINHGALNNVYAHLVLVADPTTLGRLRPLLHKETTQRLLGDLAKDFTNAPVETIEKALS